MSNGPEKLDNQKIADLFQRMDKFLAKENTQKEFLIIGSAVLIHLNMPFRATMDVDFYDNDEEDKEFVKEMASSLGLVFDPNDYQFMEEPYIQWVNTKFVHMPQTDEWKDDVEVLWQGECLTVLMPPIGVILGSKLAAARDQDFIDAKYIAETFPNWRESLKQYKLFFQMMIKMK